MSTNYTYRIGPDILTTGYATFLLFIGGMILRFSDWSDWTTASTYCMAFICLSSLGLSILLFHSFYRFARCLGIEQFTFEKDYFSYNGRRFSYSAIKHVDHEWTETNYLLWGLVDKGKAQSVDLVITFDDKKRISLTADESTIFIGLYFRKHKTLDVLRQIAAEINERSFKVRLNKYIENLRPDGKLDYDWRFSKRRDQDIINHIKNRLAMGNNPPNQTPEPTSGTVTIPAAQEVAPFPPVARL